jgi:hypothetical protein
MARDFGGVRQITVANPAPYSGKTATVNALHRVFREVRNDIVAWDSAGLDETAFGRERERLGRSYRVLIVDTGGPGSPALDATDQLVVAVDSRAGSVRAAEALLADLAGSDQAALARNAVVVVSVPGADDSASKASAEGQQAAATTAARFAGHTRAVFAATPDAWPRIGQAVAEGL